MEGPARAPRSHSQTKHALIDAGERLYALGGIEGVTLLAIARAAGQANKYSVQYHFGDRTGLIDAILEARVGWLEARRADLLARLYDAADLRALLEVLMAPIAELVDGEGRHIYARFLLQFMIQFERWDGVQHPLQRRESGYPAMRSIRARMRALTPHLSRAIQSQRFDWCLRLFLAMLVDFDNATDPGELGPWIDEAIDVAVAMLQAPSRA